MVVFVGIPITLLALARTRLGSPSPLTGMDPPWRWSVDGLRRWARSLGDGLETMDQLVDVFVRIALVAAWLCVAVIAWTTVSEAIYQLRHGMPSPRRRSDPISWIGRAIATGLIALVPVSAPAATVHAALPLRAAPVATVDGGHNAVSVAAVDTDTALPDGTHHRVASGESMWAIAEQYAAHPDRVDHVAAAILAANLGRTMNDGTRFVTAALIEPGWDLVIPAELVSNRVTRQVTVERGDSYWRLAEEHLAESGEEPTPRQVLELTKETMAHNAPRLGYSDPAMLHPGDLVEFVDGAGPEVPSPGLEDPAAPLPPPLAEEVPPPLPATPAAPVETAPAAAPTTAPAPAPPTTQTTTPTTRPPTTRPPNADADPGVVVGDDERAGVALPMGLAAAVMLATGAVAAIGSRRRRRLRAAVLSERLRTPEPALVAVERTLRAASAEERLARLDIALRAVAVDLAGQRVGVHAAALDEEGAITLWPTAAALPHGPIWRYDDDGGTWRLPASVDVVELADASRGSGQPCPALVHLGRSAYGELFVDLESHGLLCVDRCPGLVRAIAAALAVPPMAEDVRVVTVGPILAEGFDTESAETVGDALALLAEHRRAVTSVIDDRSSFVVRAGGRPSGDISPLAVVVPDGHAAELGVVDGTTCPPACGVALVIDGSVEGAFSVRPVEDEQWVLDSIGVAFRPVQIGGEDVDLVGRILSAADDPDADPAGDDAGDDRLDDEPLLWATDAAPPEDRATRFVVRLFGPVGVEVDGQPVGFSRSKAQELVVWMVQHRGRSTRQGARTALWDTDVRDATFSNVVSDARRAMARAADPPDGGEWIGRTLTEHLPLHDSVISDSDLMADLRRQAHQDPQHAAALLREALRWVRGAPYEGAPYLWPDAEGLTSQLIIQGTGIAAELAELAMAGGDTDLAFWATAQGLLVLPGHEQLVALRMRIHRQLGNLAGVRQEWESYERALRADAWSDGDPSPMLAALRHELLSGAGGLAAVDAAGST